MAEGLRGGGGRTHTAQCWNKSLGGRGSTSGVVRLLRRLGGARDKIDSAQRRVTLWVQARVTLKEASPLSGSGHEREAGLRGKWGV